MGNESIHRVLLGYVADWCQICGRVECQAAAILRSRRVNAWRRSSPFVPPLSVFAEARDLLGGSAPPGEREPIELMCASCRMKTRTEGGRFARFERPSGDPPIEIARRTMRDPAGLQEQLQRIEDLAAGRATPEERVAHIVAAIRAVDRFAVERIGPGNVTVLQSALIVLLLVSLPAAVTLGYYAQPLAYTLAASGVACASFGAIVWHSLDAGRSWAGRRLAPLIARGIRPLHPSDAELQAALDQTHRKVATIGLTVERLRTAIERDHSTPR